MAAKITAASKLGNSRQSLKGLKMSAAQRSAIQRTLKSGGTYDQANKAGKKAHRAALAGKGGSAGGAG